MFRFTIRDVLWLTVVIALAVSWWIDNKRIEKTLKAVKAEYDAKQSELDDKLEMVNQVYMDAKRNSGWHVIRGFPPKQQPPTKTAAPN